MEKSRGIRNNNPGNLVYTKDNDWKGKIPYASNTDANKHFEQFTTMAYGVRAMLRDVVNDIGKGKNTIRKLIAEYAPVFENDTEKYIQDVSKSLGIHSDETIRVLDNKFLFTLARAIINKENGKYASYVKDSDIKSAVQNIGAFKSKSFSLSIEKTDYALIIPIILFFYTVLSVTL
jgi:hypothetical protein